MESSANGAFQFSHVASKIDHNPPGDRQRIFREEPIRISGATRVHRWMDKRRRIREDADQDVARGGHLYCLVNRRETTRRLPMCRNKTTGEDERMEEGPFSGNYQGPIKARAAGTRAAESNGRLSGRRRLFIERVELSQCGSRTSSNR